MPTGFVKSTSQASRRGPPIDEVGELEHDGHRPERLREAARSGGLLADAVEAQGQRLVEHPGRLATDAQLDEHEGGAVDGRDRHRPSR